MRWICIPHETAGVKWAEEGWFFDNPEEDYRTKLRCKTCGKEERVDRLEKDIVKGYAGDDCGSPVFFLALSRMPEYPCLH